MTPQAKAAQLLLERRKARRELASWCRIAGFEPARHHLLLISKLEAVARGEIKKLMIFMPPGSAKSTYASVLFPPWFLGQQENKNVLACSHSGDLAKLFGRRSRNLVEEFKEVLGYELRGDSQAADEWSTTQGGEFFCLGVGARPAGRRADLGLIDDPVGSKQDAYSKTVRQATWDWYKFDFKTRLKPGGAIVIIQTRWHEEDLSGMLLKEEPGEWEVLSLPLIAESQDPLGRMPGERLWPEYFDQNLVKEASKDPTVLSALYQQRPTPEEGDYFRGDWIRNHVYQEGQLPPLSDLMVYGFSDHAVSLKQSADLSCLGIVGVDSSDTIWLFPELYWDRFDSADTVDFMIHLMRRYRPITWFAENGHISQSIGPFLTKRMREERCYVDVQELTPSKDKPTRAQPLRGRMKFGKVRFPASAEWYRDALHQFLTFPAGAHDDLIDGLAHIGNALDNLISGRSTTETPKEPGYLVPSEMTLRWLKDQHKRQRAEKAALLRDA